MAETCWTQLIAQLKFCWSQKYKLNFYRELLVCRRQHNLVWISWSYQTPYTNLLVQTLFSYVLIMTETCWTWLIAQLKFCWSQKYKLNFYRKLLVCRRQHNLVWIDWSYQTPYTNVSIQYLNNQVLATD